MRSYTSRGILRPHMDAARLLRTARERAGLTQAELARRAGVSQPNVAAYETGRVSPAVSSLERLLRAAGCRPVVDLIPTSSCDLSGAIGRRVRERRAEIRRLLRDHGVRRAWVYGSVARGEEQEGSDLDMLVDMDRPTLVKVASLTRRLSEELGVPVDVAVPQMLRPDVAVSVEQEGVPL